LQAIVDRNHRLATYSNLSSVAAFIHSSLPSRKRRRDALKHGAQSAEFETRITTSKVMEQRKWEGVSGRSLVETLYQVQVESRNLE
jgi:hypothetical protein